MPEPVGSEWGAWRFQWRIGSRGGSRIPRRRPRNRHRRLSANSCRSQRRQRPPPDHRPCLNPRRLSTTWTFDTVGPIARTVSDLAPVLQVLAGYDSDDPRSIDTPLDAYAPEHIGLEGVRIGVPHELLLRRRRRRHRHTCASGRRDVRATWCSPRRLRRCPAQTTPSTQQGS